MIICESEFESPDPALPDYSMCEVDYYAWIPAEAQRSMEYGTTDGRTWSKEATPNHGLSLRKNLKSGEYEVFRRFARDEDAAKCQNWSLASTGGGFGGVQIYRVEVICHSPDLGLAIGAASAEYMKFHGNKSSDKVCEHKRPIRAMSCKRAE